MVESGQSRILLAWVPVDMRLGFDGLAAKVQGVLAADPFCGHAFVFRNRRGDHRLKLLLWDVLGDPGLAITYLRLLMPCGRLPSSLSDFRF